MSAEAGITFTVALSRCPFTIALEIVTLSDAISRIYDLRVATTP